MHAGAEGALIAAHEIAVPLIKGEPPIMGEKCARLCKLLIMNGVAATTPVES